MKFAYYSKLVSKFPNATPEVRGAYGALVHISSTMPRDWSMSTCVRTNLHNRNLQIWRHKWCTTSCFRFRSSQHIPIDNERQMESKAVVIMKIPAKIGSISKWKPLKAQAAKSYFNSLEGDSYRENILLGSILDQKCVLITYIAYLFHFDGYHTTRRPILTINR